MERAYSGQLVELHGLGGGAHLNGSSGVLVGYIEEEQRWAVRLSGDAKEEVNVKPANLTLIPFDVGARVNCRNRLVPLYGESETGTVVEVRENVNAYGVRLDSGLFVNCAEEEYSVTASDSPAITMEYPAGSHVECKLEGEWMPGVIVRRNKDWLEDDSPPYLICFPESFRYRYFWGPSEHIRQCKAEVDKWVPRVFTEQKLRFGVGDRVDCRTESGRSTGTITEIWYEDKVQHQVIPYLIQLDTGDCIFAPLDEDEFIQKSNVPSPPCWICFDDITSEANPIVRQCACRGEANGFAHTECLVRLAKTKAEGNNAINSFTHCITCKQPFTNGMICERALTKECYHIYEKRENLVSPWVQSAINCRADLFLHEEDYQGARKFLENQICRVRTKIGLCSADPERLDPIKRTLCCFLFELLARLAFVNEITRSLGVMKACVDECLALEDFLVEYRPSLVQKIRAKYEFITRNKARALQCMEVAVSFERKDGDGNKMMLLDLLWGCAPLNLLCDRRERCMGQLDEAVAIEARNYGSDSCGARHLRRIAEKVRNGIYTSAKYRPSTGAHWLEWHE